MKTYFIHGKITPNGFHLKATLLKKSPKGYYLINEQIANSVYIAIRTTIEQHSLQPPRGKEVTINTDFQPSFIKEQ